MAFYNVLITGSAYRQVEADSAADAERVAAKQLADTRFGIWDMALSFTCEEMDLIEGDE